MKESNQEIFPVSVGRIISILETNHVGQKVGKALVGRLKTVKTTPEFKTIVEELKAKITSHKKFSLNQQAIQRQKDDLIGEIDNILADIAVWVELFKKAIKQILASKLSSEEINTLFEEPLKNVNDLETLLEKASGHALVFFNASSMQQDEVDLQEAITQAYDDCRLQKPIESKPVQSTTVIVQGFQQVADELSVVGEELEREGVQEQEKFALEQELLAALSQKLLRLEARREELRQPYQTVNRAKNILTVDVQRLQDQLDERNDNSEKAEQGIPNLDTLKRETLLKSVEQIVAQLNEKKAEESRVAEELKKLTDEFSYIEDEILNIVDLRGCIEKHEITVEQLTKEKLKIENENRAPEEQRKAAAEKYLAAANDVLQKSLKNLEENIDIKTRAVRTLYGRLQQATGKLQRFISKLTQGLASRREAIFADESSDQHSKLALAETIFSREPKKKDELIKMVVTQNWFERLRYRLSSNYKKAMREQVSQQFERARMFYKLKQEFAQPVVRWERIEVNQYEELYAGATVELRLLKEIRLQALKAEAELASLRYDQRQRQNTLGGKISLMYSQGLAEREDAQHTPGRMVPINH